VYAICSYLLSDAGGNPVTETVISVTDSSGNLVTGEIYFWCHSLVFMTVNHI
jgi:hypothetical protein